ncbi:hypothetical protein AK830_g1994 [Neonectria ditissima]|uniref:Interferon-induced GTP-binding protein Mx n=1 Tax=Neonectria ditissima TaxID=78410 RepID=A0A0N8H8G8_9HYPO|nr:hypothetical protein AK830_g1994 [Neonectria ditissima]
MVLHQLKPVALDNLCSSEQLQLFDSIDALRSQGINHYISLPQIIVCGDQSSGKSSVLEALSGVPFPVSSSLCTRFPTELVLRKTAAPSAKVSIIPHLSHGESDNASLADFNESLESFEDLPALIEKAKARMGIMTSGKAFSRDLLHVEISGPDRPHLTIVDLPGLIHSENRHQSSSEVDLIREMVQSYMKQRRSIILAVVSAKNDYANQVVLKLARECDPKGFRTLGVITKPDKLVSGSLSEKEYISLAKNEDIEFRLGWHVLRNADSEAEDWTLAQRDEKEADFFSTGAWTSLSSSALGVEALRGRLSNVLFHQIVSELPNLIEEITAKSSVCQQQLNKLGQPRTTVEQQKHYLFQISQSFQGLVKSAVDGTYNDPFFGDAMSVSGYQKRLRAVVQNLNHEFAKELDQHGQRHKIGPGEGVDAAAEGDSLTREEFIEKIIKLMERSRGRELPGLFHPMIVSDLFKEQSSPWEKIARAHVNKVWNSARDFLKLLIAHAADPSTVNIMMEIVVEPKLDAFLASLKEKTTGLLKQHQDGHPITYNQALVKKIEEIQTQRQKLLVKKIVEKKFGETWPGVEEPISREEFYESLMKLITIDMPHYTASLALDYVEAYYEVALRRFLDDVSVEVIETILVSKLGHILEPLTIAMMSDSQVTRIAGETSESRAIREKLQEKLRVLTSGLETCKKHLGFQLPGVNTDDYEYDCESSLETLDGHSTEPVEEAVADLPLSDEEYWSRNHVPNAIYSPDAELEALVHSHHSDEPEEVVPISDERHWFPNHVLSDTYTTKVEVEESPQPVPDDEQEEAARKAWRKALRRKKKAPVLNDEIVE